jgi:LDH2 family malate/lactate/ureidoglycolate dehydrogenase
MPLVSATDLRNITKNILQNEGATEANASRVAEGLVASNLAGHDSHGVQMVMGYANAIREGYIDPSAEPEIVQETSSTALVRGHWGFGHVAAKFALEAAVAKAKRESIAWVNLVEANHTGRVGEYVEMAVDGGIATIITVGGAGEETPMAVPFGGREALLSTNPIAFGFPAGDEPPLIADFATTTVAGGKVLLAKNKGEELPPGCVVDSDGVPSTNPEDYYDGGALVQFGGHKGYAISLLVEFMGRILGPADDFVDTDRGGPMFRRGASFRHVGVSILAMDPRTFEGSASAAEKSARFLRKLRSAPTATAVSNVMSPGDQERTSRFERGAVGIPIPDEVWDGIQALLAYPSERPRVP